MARIRSVKPEFWDDEAIGLLSRDARLMYIATWNMADDEGLLRWTASYVKANAFMYDDDLGVEQVTALMSELAGAHLVCPYIGGKARQSLGWIVQFAKHQKPNRPQPSKLPPPSITNGDVLQAYIRRDHGVCHLCGQETNTEHDDRRSWPSLDHLTPRSQGGSDYPSNLRLSHPGCNKARRDRPVESFTSTPTAKRREEAVNDSLSDAVNETVNDAVLLPLTYSPPEGRGVGGEVERSRSGGSPSGAQTIVATWLDALRKRPPGPVVGQVAKLVGQMLEEGIDSSDVQAGLMLWASKGIHPSALPSVVNEVMNAGSVAAPSRLSTTDQRVAEGLALVRHYEAQERGEIA